MPLEINLEHADARCLRQQILRFADLSRAATMNASGSGAKGVASRRQLREVERVVCLGRVHVHAVADPKPRHRDQP
jgi:hypothetical protein